MYNQSTPLQTNLLTQAFFSNTLTPINYDNYNQGSISPMAMSAFSPSPSEDSGISSYSQNSPHNNVVLIGEFINNDPRLEILEQPVEKFRFRYKSEMIGTHGSLLARNSEKNRIKIYPTVELKNFNGDAYIRCSLWSAQRDVNSRTPHTHRLIMKEDYDGDKDDPHYHLVNREKGYLAVFQGMGIIHTAKKYITDELIKKRKRLYLEAKEQNYYLTTKEEKQIREQAEQDAKKMNLNSVTLRFEAFQKDPTGKLISICDPVYSDIINNMKSALTGELKICRIDRHIGSCLGGDEIFILVEKVGKKNIKIKFFELDDDDNEIWYDYGRFNELDVHHQYAIVFKTPPYKDLNIEKNVEVYIKLERPTDGDCSESVSFCYKPSEKVLRTRKRPRMEYSNEIPSFISNLNDNNSPPHLIFNSGELEKITANPCRINSAEFQEFLNNLKSQDVSLTPFEETNIILPMETVDIDGDEINFQSIAEDVNLNTVVPQGEEIDFESKSSEKFKFDENAIRKSLFFIDENNLTEDSLPNNKNSLTSQNNKTKRVHINTNKGNTSLPLEHEMETFSFSPKTKNSIKLIPIEKLTKVFPKLKLIDSNKAKTKIVENGTITSIPSTSSTSISTSTSDKNIKQPSADEVLVRRAGLRLQQIMVEKPPKPIFDKLIKQVFSLNNEDGDNALHLAVNYKMHESLQMMLKVFNKNNFEELINCKNNKQLTPLHVAIIENNILALKLLIEAGADPNAFNGSSQTPLHLICSGQYDDGKCFALNCLLKAAGDKLKLNLKSEKGWTCFHEAIFRNNILAVESLIQAGVNINEPELTHGSTPLALAVKEKHIDMIELLLKQPSLDINACDREGNTPLHEAIVSKSTEIVKLLLSHGANRFQKNCRKRNKYEVEEESRKEMIIEDIPIKSIENIDIKEEREDDYESSSSSIGENSIHLAHGNTEMLNILLNVKNEDKSSGTDSNQPSPNSRKSSNLFDDEFVEKLCQILNKSNRWMALANLMDYSYLIDNIKEMPTPSKILLRHFEMDAQYSINDLRQFLDILEEPECVAIIDDMLEKQHENTKS